MIAALISLLLATAPDRPALVLKGAVVDPVLGLAFINVEAQGDLSVPIVDPGIGMVYATKLSAVLLATGKELWKTALPFFPVYSHGGKVVVIAPDREQVIWVVLDAKNGKELARFPTGVPAPQEPRPQHGCTLQTGPHDFTSVRQWGEGGYFWSLSETSHCEAAAPRGGVQLSDELEHNQRRHALPWAPAPRCHSSNQQMRLNLDPLTFEHLEKPSSPPPLHYPMESATPLINRSTVVQVACVDPGCHSKKVTLEQFSVASKMKRSFSLVEASDASAGLSIDGAHVFAFLLKAPTEQAKLAVFDTQTGAVVKRAAGVAPHFIPHALVGDVLIGHDNDGVVAFLFGSTVPAWRVVDRAVPQLELNCSNPP